jgi:hypothetical protein
MLRLCCVLPARVHDDQSGQWSYGPSIQPAFYPALGLAWTLVGGAGHRPGRGGMAWWGMGKFRRAQSIRPSPFHCRQPRRQSSCTRWTTSELPTSYDGSKSEVLLLVVRRGRRRSVTELVGHATPHSENFPQGQSSPHRPELQHHVGAIFCHQKSRRNEPYIMSRMPGRGEPC